MCNFNAIFVPETQIDVYEKDGEETASTSASSAQDAQAESRDQAVQVDLDTGALPTMPTRRRGSSLSRVGNYMARKIKGAGEAVMESIRRASGEDSSDPAFEAMMSKRVDDEIRRRRLLQQQVEHQEQELPPFIRAQEDEQRRRRQENELPPFLRDPQEWERRRRKRQESELPPLLRTGTQGQRHQPKDERWEREHRRIRAAALEKERLRYQAETIPFQVRQKIPVDLDIMINRRQWQDMKNGNFPALPDQAWLRHQAETVPFQVKERIKVTDKEDVARQSNHGSRSLSSRRRQRSANPCKCLQCQKIRAATDKAFQCDCLACQQNRGARKQA